MTLSFRKYLELEQLKKQLIEQAESVEFPIRVFDYLSACLPSKDLEKQDWRNTVFSLVEAMNRFRPTSNIPLLKDHPKEKEKSAEWDYDGRDWFFWSSLFARTFGWTLEYIGDLDVDDALALAQEILTDEQLDKEFYYSLSEIAYPYNKNTKKQHFKPMSRPYWMRPAFKEIKMVKVKRSLLPVGQGVDLTGLPVEYGISNYLNNELSQEKTEETQPPPSP